MVPLPFIHKGLYIQRNYKTQQFKTYTNVLSDLGLLATYWRSKAETLRNFSLMEMTPGNNDILTPCLMHPLWEV
eukprot:bmy_03450T0